MLGRCPDRVSSSGGVGNGGGCWRGSEKGVVISTVEGPVIEF